MNQNFISIHSFKLFFSLRFESWPVTQGLRPFQKSFSLSLIPPTFWISAFSMT